MSKGKYAKSVNYKPLALLLAMSLLVGCAIGGTVAWLADKTEPVKNTFTTSNVDIELAETKNAFKMIPGWTIEKDPVVTVKKGSEDCYLFVKVEKSCGVTGKTFDDYIACNLETDREDDGKKVWTKLEGVDNVYYIKVIASEVSSADKQIHLLLAGEFTDDMGTTDTKDDVKVSWTNDHVATKPSVTKEMMEAIDGVAATTEAAQAEVAARPTITFTAYASQLKKNNTTEFTAAEAWENCPKS